MTKVTKEIEAVAKGKASIVRCLLKEAGYDQRRSWAKSRAYEQKLDIRLVQRDNLAKHREVGLLNGQVNLEAR